MSARIRTDPDTITRLNTLVKASKNGHKDAIARFHDELANFARMRSTEKHSWSLSPTSKWVNGIILLIVHWDKPMRSLVVVNKREVEHPITACLYEFRKLHYTVGKTSIGIDAQSKQHQRLYAKKGFWLVLDESVDWKLFWPAEGVKEDKNPALFNRLKDVYLKYVKGMEKAPKDDVLATIQRPYGGTEQFLLDMYPTAEWNALFPEDELLPKQPKGKQKKYPNATHLESLAAAAASAGPLPAYDQPKILEKTVIYEAPPHPTSFPVETIYMDGYVKRPSTPQKRKSKVQKVTHAAPPPPICLPSPPPIDWKKYEESDFII